MVIVRGRGDGSDVLRYSSKPLVIAARPSALARAQAERVGQALARLHRGLEVRYRWLRSAGDRHQQVMAEQPVGGKGQFTGVIEQAVLAGEADLAVHSLKDLPGEETKGLTLAAIPPRASFHDCLISRAGASSLAELAGGAVVGTSSPRRAAQVRRIRPDVTIRPIRGNVQTRLNKVLDPAADQPEAYDATLLAEAGLSRLDLEAYATQPLSTGEVMPAACQGALGLQCRADDHTTMTRCLPLNDPAAAEAAHAERQVVAALGADCHSPVAVLAQRCAPPASQKRHEGEHFQIEARVASPDGGQLAAAQRQASTRRLRHAVNQLIDDLKQQRAEAILAAARRMSGV